MHGMGSRLVEYEKNIIWLRQAYPGIYIKNLNTYPGPPSQMTHMTPQQVRISQEIKSDPMLQQGFNFYGESQGGLQARAYVTLDNDPPVHNLVAISGPQEGVGLCPTLDMPIIKQICADGAPILDIYHWPKCSFCDFWHGLDEKKYLKNNQWLADLNNAKEQKDASKAARMKSLNFYMASAGSDDKVVQPRESAWHTFWPWGGPQTEKAVLDWRQTEGYKGDWLGLKTLDEQGKLEFNMYEGTHTAYNSSWWLATVLPVFNNKLSALKALDTTYMV
jgi:palmitoyl-protein thioesterase